MYKSKKREAVTLPINNHWFRVSLNPLKNNEGKITGVIHVATDITRTKKNSDALKESEERYRSIFTNTNDMISTITKEGIVTSLNLSSQVVTGWSPDELIGQHFSSLVHPDDVSLVTSTLGNAQTGKGAIYPLVLQIKTKSGAYRAIEFLMTRLYSKSKLTGFLTIGRDITAQKR